MQINVNVQMFLSLLKVHRLVDPLTNCTGCLSMKAQMEAQNV